MVSAPNRSEQHSHAGLEVELKFELTQHDVRTLCGSAAFKAMQCEPLRRKTMRATYFDTPKLDLFARGISLRVRKEGRRFVQCVKAAADTEDGGGFARREWEWPVTPTLVAGSGFDAALLRGDAELKPLFKGVAAKKLQAIFTTEISRQTRVLVTPGGARITCDIDQGRVLSGEREAPIYELELELASGSVAELLELARLVTQTVPARLSTRTKAHRGMTLFANQGHTWVRGEPLALPKAATAEDVLHTSMLESLKHLLRNEDCVLTRCHNEGVHQMRVAMRRMRSLLTTYKGLLLEGSYEALAEQLQQAAGELGPARDWDVFVDELLNPVEAV
ncbi:MAG TPA: inorganic triphosphatase, partial [Magnetovibrio sp.]